MNTPFKKRANPIEEKSEQTPVQVAQPVVESKPEPKPEPVVETKVESRPVESKKAIPQDSVKEKYTAVMDRELRKRVKVASINLGLDYSTFIEEAVSEKLAKEGF